MEVDWASPAVPPSNVKGVLSVRSVASTSSRERGKSCDGMSTTTADSEYNNLILLEYNKLYSQCL